jgi:hypothetical protein
MPLQLDHVTRIIDVHWGDTGLAVEFGDKATDAPKPGDEDNTE